MYHVRSYHETMLGKTWQAVAWCVLVGPRFVENQLGLDSPSALEISEQDMEIPFSQLKPPLELEQSEKGGGEEDLPSSATHRAEWLRLDRVAKGSKAKAQFPQIAEIFASGNMLEKRKCLKKYLENGSNMATTEGSFTAERLHKDKTKRNLACLTLKEMKEEGFSKFLGKIQCLSTAQRECVCTCFGLLS